MNNQESINVLRAEFIKESHKIERFVFKAEKFLDELSKGVLDSLLEEIKTKTYQKTLPLEYMRIFSSNHLLKPFTKMLNFYYSLNY